MKDSNIDKHIQIIALLQRDHVNQEVKDALHYAYELMIKERDSGNK